MTVKGLRVLSRRLFKLSRALKEAAKRDSGLGDVAGLAEQLDRKVATLANQRSLLEAERKDKGKVLWELFVPRNDGGYEPSIFDRAGKITRTPNRIIRDLYSLTGASVHVVSPANAWPDLGDELKTRPLDLDKFRRHAARVDASYRKWVAAGAGEEDLLAAGGANWNKNTGAMEPTASVSPVRTVA